MKKSEIKIDPEKKWKQLSSGEWLLGISVANIKKYLGDCQSQTISVKNLLFQLKGKERVQQQRAREIILAALVAELIEQAFKLPPTKKRKKLR